MLAVMAKDESDEMLTVDRAAEILKVSHMTVRRYMKQGRLPRRRLGREYVLYRSDLDHLTRPEIGRPKKCAETPAPYDPTPAPEPPA